MASTADFDSLYSQLQNLTRSTDYRDIGNKLDRQFDKTIKSIFVKWRSNEIVSKDELKFVDLYSNLQLSFSEHFFFDSNPATHDQNDSELFLSCLFRNKEIDELKQAVRFIRDEQKTSDEMLIYIMRMLDARAFAYRLYYRDLLLPPDTLNEELKTCLTHDHAKTYLYTIKSNNQINSSLTNDTRYKFFVGCCTFSFALYDKNRDYFKSEGDKKYIYLLAKYVRVVLSKTNFERDSSSLYCLRGVLALLNNCIPTEHWMSIINKALANEDDDEAQQTNPFNIDLFSLIIKRLFGSTVLRDRATQSNSHDATSLIDVALIFLNKWFDISKDLNDDDNEDDEEENANGSQLPVEENQVLRLLRTNQELQTSQLIIPFLNAKYDRLRLMTIATLSYIMSYRDLSDLQTQRPQMAHDIVELIFHFIDRAKSNENQTYKGVPFDRLLRYLLRFLGQDTVKQAMIPHISQIVSYVQQNSLYTFRILRKLSSSPKMKQHLLDNVELTRFLKEDADVCFRAKPKEKKMIDLINQNLASPKQPEPPRETHRIFRLQKQGKLSFVSLAAPSTGIRNAFISYCHDNQSQCDRFLQKLEETRLFEKIWIDHEDLRGNLVDGITKAIHDSQIVFLLLSVSYGQSDYCRKEFEFSLDNKKTIYYVFLDKSFKKKTYDWISFQISSNFYYRIHDDSGLEILIRAVRGDVSKVNEGQLQIRRETTNNTGRTQVSSQSTTESNPSRNTPKTRNSSVVEWTQEDVQDWCVENHLEIWCKPLTNYQGRGLIALQKVLVNDSVLQNIANGHKLTMIDVVLFRCELDKLLSSSTTVRQPVQKKHIEKRRWSKESNK